MPTAVFGMDDANCFVCINADQFNNDPLSLAQSSYVCCDDYYGGYAFVVAETAAFHGTVEECLCEFADAIGARGWEFADDEPDPDERIVASFDGTIASDFVRDDEIEYGISITPLANRTMVIGRRKDIAAWYKSGSDDGRSPTEGEDYVVVSRNERKTMAAIVRADDIDDMPSVDEELDALDELDAEGSALDVPEAEPLSKSEAEDVVASQDSFSEEQKDRVSLMYDGHCDICDAPLESEESSYYEHDGTHLCPDCMRESIELDDWLDSPEEARKASHTPYDCEDCGTPLGSDEVMEFEGRIVCPDCYEMDMDDVKAEKHPSDCECVECMDGILGNRTAKVYVIQGTGTWDEPELTDEPGLYEVGQASLAIEADSEDEAKAKFLEQYPDAYDLRLDYDQVEGKPKVYDSFEEYDAKYPYSNITRIAKTQAECKTSATLSRLPNGNWKLAVSNPNELETSQQEFATRNEAIAFAWHHNWRLERATASKHVAGTCPECGAQVADGALLYAEDADEDVCPACYQYITGEPADDAEYTYATKQAHGIDIQMMEHEDGTPYWHLTVTEDDGDIVKEGDYDSEELAQEAADVEDDGEPVKQMDSGEVLPASRKQAYSKDDYAYTPSDDESTWK